MTATYTNQPGVRDVDTVRMLIDDRDTIPATDASFTDEELQFFIDNNNHIYLAAAAAADGLVAIYTGDASQITIADGKVEYDGTRVIQAKALARQLRSQAAKGASPFAGGLTESGKTTVAADTDRIQPNFTVGQDDHARSGQTTDRGVIDY